METLMLVLDMAMISLFVLLSLFIGIFGAGLMFYIRKVRYFIEKIVLLSAGIMLWIISLLILTLLSIIISI